MLPWAAHQCPDRSSTYQTHPLTQPPLISHLPFSCKRLPKELIDKNAALLYFKEFGRIRQITHTNPGGICQVEYETVEEARRALHESGFYKGTTFVVQSGNTAHHNKSRPAFSADPSVQAELDIMSGTQANNNNRLPPRQQQSQHALKSLSAFQRPPQLPLLSAKKAFDAMPPPPTAASKPPTSPVMIHKMTVPELQRLIATPAFSSEQK